MSYNIRGASGGHDTHAGRCQQAMEGWWYALSVNKLAAYPLSPRYRYHHEHLELDLVTAALQWGA